MDALEWNQGAFLFRAGLGNTTALTGRHQREVQTLLFDADHGSGQTFDSKVTELAQAGGLVRHIVQSLGQTLNAESVTIKNI